MKHLAFALLAGLAAGPALAEAPAAAPDAAPAAGAERSAPAAAPAPAAPGGHAGHMGHAAAPACAEPKPECAVTAHPAFARDGRLWIAFAVGDTVYAASSKDLAKSFEPAVVVAKTENGVIDANGEARPKLTPLPHGAFLASYTLRPEKTYNGTVFTARSNDGGKTFEPAQKLVDDTGQRFDVLGVSPKGRLYAVWLDKRDAAKAKAEGKDFAGSGIAAAWSDDGGVTFKGKDILMDHSCECCRVSMAFDKDGQPVFAWRHVFEGNLRDHYAAKLSADGTKLDGGRVSEDEWATNTCPHQGPALAIDSAGAWHVVWFTTGKKRQGLFYARSADGGKSFSEPEKFGDDDHAPARPYLLASKGRLYRAWKEFDGTTTTVRAQDSRDGGKSWSAPRVVASTQDASDYPILIDHKGVAYLSWLTRTEGYRLLPLGKAQAEAPHRQKSAEAR